MADIMSVIDAAAATDPELDEYEEWLARTLYTQLMADQDGNPAH